jgi:hypothetical protein
MVYQQKLVAVIKHNGKILREVDNNTVYLPFLAEYEIFLKNLESRDVVINISIDGEDVLDNQQLVIKANSNCSLEGFLKDNKVTNKFKFIQKTEKIINHRGDKVDDGLIRIEYTFTKINQTITTTHHNIHETHWFHPAWCTCPRCLPWRVQPLPYQHNPFWTTSPIVTYGGAVSGNAFIMQSMTGGCGGPAHSSSNGQPVGSMIGGCGGSAYSSSNGQSVGSISSNAFMPQFIEPTEGITVKGSESNQQLDRVETSPLEDQSYVIVLKLRGCDNSNQPVEKPVLVSTKVKCSTCGRSNKSNIKYCPECGTATF